MTPQKKAKRGRTRIYAPNMSRKEKRLLRAQRKLEATGVEIEHEDTRPDKVLLQDMIDRFKMLREMAKAAAEGAIPSLCVPGAPGIGKTYNIEDVMTIINATWSRVTGTISAIELFKEAYRFRFKGNVIVIDDGDKVFRDEDTLNLLKAMTDSSRTRMLNWRTNSEFLDAEDGEEPIEKTFIYNGSVIFLSNLNFQDQVDSGRGKNVDHMGALISRSYYLDLKIHNRRAISLWINHVCTEGKMFEVEGIDAETGKKILKWCDDHQGKLREYSLRTVHKVCNLVKMGPTWETAALYTLCR